MRFDEFVQRLPARLRGLGGDKVLQRGRPVTGFGEFLHQRSQLGELRRIAHEIEPRHPAPVGLGLRERRDPTHDRLFHQRQHVPRHRTPGRRDERVLLLVRGRLIEVDLDDRPAVVELQIGDRQHGFFHADDADALEPLPHQPRRGGDLRVVGFAVRLSLAPAERQRVRKEMVGRLHLGAVVERRGRDPVLNLRHRTLAGTDRSDPPSPRLRRQRVGRNANGLAGLLLVARTNFRAVENPAAVVRNGQERVVADRRPGQPADRVGEARDRIPGRRCRRVDSDPQPAVPGKILELDGPQEHRRIESGLRVECDVLDAVGKLVAVELAPQPVADHSLLAVFSQGRDQLALEIDPLGLVPELRMGETRVDGLGVLARARLAEGGCVAEQVVGLEPALLDPRRRRPSYANAGRAHQIFRRDLVEAQIPIDRVQAHIRRQRNAGRIAVNDQRPPRRIGRRQCGHHRCEPHPRDAVDVAHIVGVIGRDRIAMKRRYRNAWPAPRARVRARGSALPGWQTRLGLTLAMMNEPSEATDFRTGQALRLRTPAMRRYRACKRVLVIAELPRRAVRARAARCGFPAGRTTDSTAPHGRHARPTRSP